VVSGGVVMCMEGLCWRKRALIIDMGKRWNRGHGARRVFRAFLFCKWKRPQDSLLVSPFPNNEPCNGETSKSEEGVARWLSNGSLIEGPVAPFWSEWQSQMSKSVTTQRSERVCPRGRPRGHPAIKYSIIDR
jgi:hypothetical protein